MNDNRELVKLKNSIAIRTILKCGIYSIIAILVFSLVIDGVYNDAIADNVSGYNRNLYLFFVQNKTATLTIFYMMVFLLISFIVVRNMSDKMLEIMNAINQIIKEPEKNIKLSDDLSVLENKLNKIRLDLIQSQNEAREAENKKNDLIMYMAHDLKTPLTSVIGYLTLLTDEKDISKKSQEKYIKIALDKSLRVEELTNQFFEITRYNLKDIPINKQNIDLSLLIEQLVDECYPMLQEKNLKCVVNKKDHTYYLGDGDKLARAFDNLLKNAINYSYKNSNIEIKVMEDSEKIALSFKNKGDKIPEYKLEKLFDKFYRADEARQSSTGGTGLGLAIAKEIIELHNGSISVKNDDEYIEFNIELRK